MPQLYGRQISVFIGNLQDRNLELLRFSPHVDVSELRISFEIERDIDETQAKGQVNIYNLSPENEEAIDSRGTGIRVEAGYPETKAIVFEGQIQRIIRHRENHARITRIKIGDEVRQKERLGGVYVGSVAGAVPVRQIVRDIASAIGLELGPLDAIPADATYTDFWWAERADLGLARLLRSVDCYWFESDGLIRIDREGVLQFDAPFIEVSPNTGLVRSPIHTDEGAEAVVLLNPAIQLGCQVNIKSLTVNGKWKVISMRHKADNWQGRFTTHIDLREIE